MKNRFVLLYIFLAGLACAPKNNTVSEGFREVYSCDAEEVGEDDGFFYETSGKSITFGNVDAHTWEFSFSGNYALKLSPLKPYGFTTALETGPNDYIRVTAWRKNGNNNGVIVIDGGEGFYRAGKFITDENENGWEKLMVEGFVPPDFVPGNVRVYVWNNSQDTAYFDDIRILHSNKKIYPEYDIKNTLSINTEEENLYHFDQKRVEAFKLGVLVNSDEDFASAVIFDGNDFLNGEIRLKGDLVDHIQGDKWSFRIKLKKDFSWNGMRTFSVQNPGTRNFLYEWLAHKVFAMEDVLTTRYGFVPVYVNNQSRGIYAWEEHFEKHLLESNNRREGVIVRFDETLFWQRVIETNKTGRDWDIDYFGGSKITPFKESTVASDSMMVRQMEEAQKLMRQYKNQSAPVSEIFDADKLARYYALMDITQAYHGFTWHNQRFYFNPVTCLLEPIAFDGFIEGGIYKRNEEPVISLLDAAKIAGFNKEELMLYQVFTDSLFNRKYVKYLKKYADENYISQVASAYQPESDSLEAIIRQEFPYYRFNFDFMENQGRLIRDNMEAIEANIPKLETAFRQVNREKFEKQFTSETNPNLMPLLVHTYFNKGAGRVDFLNFYAGEISVLGALVNDNLPESFESQMVLPACDGINPGRASVGIQGNPYKIIFSAGDGLLETEVTPWAYADGMSSKQQLLHSELKAELPWVGDSVIFDGKYTFKTDVFIPANTPVVFLPGSQINLVEKAGFFSFSAVKSLGNEDNPVEFFSGDKTSQGVHIFQTSERSVLRHTRFYHLGNIRKGGWQTPSAVTFYEADVDMAYCTFESNVNCDDVLNTVRCDFYVENCRFVNTFADAFDSDFCTGIVENCTFINTGNDAIDFSGSRAAISGCNMTEIGDKAISGGENSTLVVKNCRIEKAVIGVAAKDLSTIDVNKIEIRKTVYGFVTFVKKTEFGPATITVDNLIMKNNIVFHQVEEGSTLTVNGRSIYGREKKLALKLYQ